VDRHDRILAIVLSAEHFLGLAGIDLRGELVERPGELLQHRLPGLGPLHQHGEIVDPRLERSAEIAVLLDAPASLEQFLSGFLVLPEIRRCYPGFDLGEFISGVGGVKDNSANRSRGARGLRICGAARRGGWS
jgi:hypothetical protein